MPGEKEVLEITSRIRKEIAVKSRNFYLRYVRPLVPGGGNQRRIYIKKDGAIPSLLYFVLGIREAGKSTFLEWVAEQYLMLPNTSILDIFGSADGENLAWLRSPWGKVLSVLLLKHPEIPVVSMRPNIIVKDYDEFSYTDIDKYDIILTSTPFYPSGEEEMDAIASIIDEIYKRRKWKRKGVLIVREAARLLYSRIKYTKNQTRAKAQYITLLRESRHMGLVMLLDTQKFTSVDLDVRSQMDIFVVKNLGYQSLPEDLAWVYRWVEPDFFRNLPPENFIVITRKGMVGAGYFPYVDWHKEENEDIFEHIPIKIRR